MGGLTDVIESSGIIDVVSKAAPLLGSILGSPLASVALSFLSEIFGVSSSDVNGLVDKIAGDPEANAKLKELEYNHAEALEKIAAQLYATEVDDRKDARQNSVPYKDFLMHLAYVVTGLFFVAFVMLFLPIPFDPDEHDLLLVLVGMLASKWQTIIDFFYGSSRTENKKFPPQT